jgi:hypothetical protein
MSKGPGKPQRRILAALEKVPAFYLVELCAKGSHAEYAALNRAAWKLCAAEKITIWTYRYFCPRILITRRGYPCPRERPERWIVEGALDKC